MLTVIRKDKPISSGLGGRVELLEPIRSGSPLALFVQTHQDI
ncbi:protein of unknown function [Candidatus Methylopumilus turicensis]|uniref:Uncharacterized protein n=1 Tax=Candidatus Methylopumilus turicensis TaxID=1581680 RepID=A0A0B7ISS8_9PROT|nr:protein of unknown function [Candidatus Methylopumilus turicensis]